MSERLEGAELDDGTAAGQGKTSKGGQRGRSSKTSERPAAPSLVVLGEGSAAGGVTRSDPFRISPQHCWLLSMQQEQRQ